MFNPGNTLTLFAISGACCFGMLWANQDGSVRTTTIKETQAAAYPSAPASPPTIATTVYSSDDFPGYGTSPSTSYRYNTTIGPGSPVDQAYSKAIKSYKDAKPDSAERKEARDKVAASLSEQYDEQLTRQEKQIEEMADRLEKLRAQVAKRREAKARMVELKLEMVLSHADGLGWPEDGAPQFFAPNVVRNVLANPPATALPAIPAPPAPAATAR